MLALTQRCQLIFYRLQIDAVVLQLTKKLGITYPVEQLSVPLYAVTHTTLTVTSHPHHHTSVTSHNIYAILVVTSQHIYITIEETSYEPYTTLAQVSSHHYTHHTSTSPHQHAVSKQLRYTFITSPVVIIVISITSTVTHHVVILLPENGCDVSISKKTYSRFQISIICYCVLNL